MCPEFFFRWGEGIVLGCLNLLNNIVSSFIEEIIFWILEILELEDRFTTMEPNRYDIILFLLKI